MSPGLSIGVLGPLEVRAGDTPLVIGAPKQRALLAMLALEVGRVVSTDQLVDRLWEGRGPPTAVATLQVYVSQLRKLVGDDAIATRRPGYSLLEERCSVDAAKFERLAAAGHGLLAEQDFRSAEPVLAEALGLWRGAALGEFILRGVGGGAGAASGGVALGEPTSNAIPASW